MIVLGKEEMNLEPLNIIPKTPVATVSMISPLLKGHGSEEEAFNSLSELKQLCRTLKLDHRGQYCQKKYELNPATLLGRGKLVEIAQMAKEKGAELLVFDFELSASQVRNIRELTELFVIDRCQIILEIFARHAHTKEAKIQVEVSRLEYLLPRLSSLWTHFTRQKGGIGLKGEGEQQLELDRRLIRSRIQFLKRQLKVMEKSGDLKDRRRRQKSVTAALVGYTNAGKSSLMNRLCRAGVGTEDKLFATLDVTHRTLNPDTKPPMLLIDTVGFIQNLPSTLVNGFKSTLKSVSSAELLLIVCDISNAQVEKHLQVTEKLLDELGLHHKDRLIIFNKKDQLSDELWFKVMKKKYPHSCLVSSYDKEDMVSLRKAILDYFLKKQKIYELFVPYEERVAHSQISAKTNIMALSHHETGIFYKVRTPDFIFDSLKLRNFLTGKHSFDKRSRR